MKSLIVCLCLVASIFAKELFSQRELAVLRNLDRSDLPRYIKTALRRIRRQVQGHWCCANDQPINSIQRSKISMEMVKVTEKVKIGYTECKWLGSGRCSLYDVRYRSQPTYFTDYYEVPDMKACPDQHVKCCKGFVMIANENCISLDEAKEHIETLKDLIAAGLIG
ncbi:uncharacterized protein LOC141899913 [Tubulanus polymorphus]|uniref:uncharacterized protein LOC141899913 n=1 Tax=Tubulanus polymorphus TaxID=672921 RepID=UPI003DA27B47